MAIPGIRTSDEGARVIVPPEISADILALVREKSIIQTLSKNVPMARDTRVLRHVASGVTAYFVGAGEVKPKSGMAFAQVSLVAHKIAVIVPVEDELLSDADIDLASVVRDDAIAAIGEGLDAACMGYDPSSPFDITLSDGVDSDKVIPYESIPESVNQAMAAIESEGYEPGAMITHPRVKALLRGLTDEVGRPIFLQNITGTPNEYTLYGLPIYFSRMVPVGGSPSTCEILMADWNYVIMGNRNALEVTISKDATLTQGTNEPINLFEQDMTAFRFVLRKGFTVLFPDKTLSKVVSVEV